MPSDKQKEGNNELLIDYMSFRKFLGWMGIGLPFALIIGSFIWTEGYIETSISNYYHTCLREIFVVTLSAVSLFLFTYRGYDWKDRLVTNLAGGFGLLTVFISTNLKNDIFLPGYKLMSQRLNDDGGLIPLNEHCIQICEPYKIIPSIHADYWGYVHLGCAALFFLALAYMSYFQFTKTSKEELPTRQKLKRNKFYKTCALIMLFCVLALVPCFVIPSLRPFYNAHKLVFWGETISLWAFGASWLVKGEFLLFKD